MFKSILLLEIVGIVYYLPIMLPLLWKYLGGSYLRAFLLSVTSFVAILIVMRLQEIARFATSGASPLKVTLFALLQIPYILPIAIPISCLISTLVLFHRMSFSHELTALRTCGLSLNYLRTPLLTIGAITSLLNFTIASELAPYCKSVSKEFILDVVKANPLFPLQRDSLVKLKNAYYHIGALQGSTSAQDVLLVTKNSNNNSMTLAMAKELQIENSLLVGKQIAFISSVDSKKQEKGFDHLIIENQSKMETEANHLSQFLHIADWNRTNPDYLRFHELLAYSVAKKGSWYGYNPTLIEMGKRISMGLAPLTLILLGTGFGIQIGRNPSRRGIFISAILTAFLLSCFTAAKSLQSLSLLSLPIFLAPHALIFFLSLRNLHQIKQGVE